MPQRVPPCQPSARARGADQQPEANKSPGERLPVGVLSWGLVVSSVRSCWRREAVALHALGASLHDIDLHRLTSSSSGSANRAALVLGWSDGDAILAAVIGDVAAYLGCGCRRHALVISSLFCRYSIPLYAFPVNLYNLHKIKVQVDWNVCLIFRYCMKSSLLVYYSHQKGNSPDNRDRPPKRGRKGVKL